MKKEEIEKQIEFYKSEILKNQEILAQYKKDLQELENNKIDYIIKDLLKKGYRKETFEFTIELKKYCETVEEYDESDYNTETFDCYVHPSINKIPQFSIVADSWHGDIDFEPEYIEDEINKLPVGYIRVLREDRKGNKDLIDFQYYVKDFSHFNFC